MSAHTYDTCILTGMIRCKVILEGRALEAVGLGEGKERESKGREGSVSVESLEKQGILGEGVSQDCVLGIGDNLRKSTEMERERDCHV